MNGFASLDDIIAFESIPLAERSLPASTYAGLQRSAEKYPNHEALIFFLQAAEYQRAVRYTFPDLLARVNQTANMFHALGVGPTDVVSYILPNLPQTYFTLFGGEAAGIANPINPLLEPHALADIMNAARTRVLVTLASFPKTDIWEKVSTILDQVPTLETVLQVDIAGYLNGFKKLAVNLMRLGKSRGRRHVQVLDFDRTMRQFPGDRLISGRQIAPGDVAAYFHTGGTTGTPKLAIHTHWNQVYDGWAAAHAVSDEDGKLNLLGLPLFHNYGAIAVGLGAWLVGSGVVMATPSGFRGEGVIENFWKILAHYHCAMFSGVPTLFKALLNVPSEGIDLSHLEAATCGAAPLPVELARQFTAKTNVEILEGYGLTEATSVCTVNPRAGRPRIGSIGFRLPYQEIRVAELAGLDFVRFCEPNESGVLLIRGPNVFPGYKEAYHNKGAFVDAGDGGERWLNTGDIGFQDGDGYIWLTGRKKELIIRGGHNIDPKQIEEPLATHPAVAMAAAVGRPDPRVGEVPVAYVELKPGAVISEGELLAFAEEKIGERAAVPRKIYIIDQLPQTAVGKIFKPQLSRRQIEEVFSTALGAVEGVAGFSVQAEGDKRLGTIAFVTVKTAPGVDPALVEKQVRDTLGQYAVNHEIQVDSAAG